MSKLMSVPISTKVLARLFILGEMEFPLEATLKHDQIDEFLKAVLACDLSDLIHYIDLYNGDELFGTDDVPQSSQIITINKCIDNLVDCGKGFITDYRMGAIIQNAPEKHRDTSCRRLGESYRKTIVKLGLASSEKRDDYGIILNPLTVRFRYLRTEERTQVLIKLCIRFPIIRNLIRNARFQKYNGYDQLQLFRESTKKRRGQEIRRFLKDIRTFECQEINDRIDNIVWEME